MQNKSFLKFGWATLVVVFCVIIAGSVVRMSGSGMGCPDWPKCFGYIIPPTQTEQVQFQPNTAYKKGQMIVHGNELQYATNEFKSSLTYQKENWKTYEVHDYAIFNPVHTWTEYINRLFGALSGLFMFIWFLWSIALAIKKKVKWSIPILLFIGVILLGFQAWLGKVVVDTHLDEVILSAHMYGAIALIMVILAGLRYSEVNYEKYLSKSTKIALGVSLLLLLVQTHLGTEFRMVVDEVTGHTASFEKDFTKAFIDSSFTTHMLFAFVALFSLMFAMYFAQNNKEWHPPFTYLAIFSMVEIGLGFLLKALDIPFLSQPLHLLIAFILIALNTWLLLFKTEKG